ncbi:cytochrome b [Catenovulum sp. SM1970]|uniref:cytochrome b n=1 Tax=Marinifaba aquimaris TaxID=2741323 RepID=UPI00157309C3|nr:cytochrome b [Marinifaba aquimaris]NTS76330.1 cytochrome b [Marinifaba aquimaris]
MTTQSTQATRTIHWLSALLIIGLLASGLYMTDGHDYSFYDWHKSFGVIALLLIAIRLYNKFKNPWQSSAKGTEHEKIVNIMHHFLLFACVMMPISGMAYSGLGGHGVAVFGLTIIPDNYNAAGQAVPFSETGRAIGQQIHVYLGYAMVALVSLHVLAALKHHFIDKDNTLTRMLSANGETRTQA